MEPIDSPKSNLPILPPTRLDKGKEPMRLTESVVQSKPSSVPIHFDPYHEQSAHEPLQQMARIEKELKASIDILELKSPEPLATILNEKGLKLEKAVIQAEQLEKTEEFVHALVAPELSLLELIASKPALMIELQFGELFHQQELSEKIGMDLTVLELAVGLPKSIGTGADLLMKRQALNRIHMELYLLEKKKDPRLQHKIDEVKAYLNVQEDLIKKEAIEWGIETVAYFPDAIKLGLQGGGYLTPVASAGVLFGGLVIKAGADGYHFYRAIDAHTVQKNWMKTIQGKPLAKREVQALLDKRKKAFESSENREWREFEAWYDRGALRGYEFLAELKKYGIDARADAVLKQRSLEEILQMSPKEAAEDRKKLWVEYLQERKEDFFPAWRAYKQAVNVQIRNGVKSLALAKQKAERKFFTFNLAASGATFALSVLAAATLITLKVLVVAGVVAIPSIALSSTGVGVIAVGFAIAAAGLLFLYWQKPHLFKSLFNVMRVQALATQIPKAINDFRIERAKLQEVKNALQAEAVSARLIEIQGLKSLSNLKVENLPQSLKPFVKDLQKKDSADLDAIEKKLRTAFEKWEIKKEEIEKERLRLEEKGAEYQKRLAPLREKIAMAGWLDFKRCIDLKTTPDDVAKAIVEGILSNPSLLEKETAEVLSIHLGIPLGAFEKEVDQEKIKSALLDFFALNDKGMLQFIKLQSEKLKILQEREKLNGIA